MVVTNECTSVTCHFDGHGGSPVQYKAHRPMQHDQGFTGSHWTPPLGDYLLRIAPSAARAAINSTWCNMYSLCLPIDGHCDAAVYRAHRPMEEVRAFIKATKRHHRTSTRSDIIKGTHQLWLFWTFHREKELQLTCWPLKTIGVWHIKLTRST